MRNFVRFVDRLSDACAVAAAFMLVAAMLIVCWMVVYRALGNSTYWEIELATYLIVATVLVGSPYCLKTRGHIGVDLVSEWLSPRGRRILARILAALGLAVCLYLTWKGLELTVEAWQKGEHSGSTWNPLRWPFFAMMPLGLGLTALQYVADFLRSDPDAADAPAPISGQGA
ncbi:MAG TPA: TRAP transporter small permease subunit [Usitatibacteraceae bacterium]|nr:TRAP transporter small permease subunit [Usitatibacteraceae bacterium]